MDLKFGPKRIVGVISSGRQVSGEALTAGEFFHHASNAVLFNVSGKPGECQNRNVHVNV